MGILRQLRSLDRGLGPRHRKRRLMSALEKGAVTNGIDVVTFGCRLNTYE
ncbi:tRNA (N(6)-L-threonylcarbamoyladenosine(37)-C(2))-methylthiotransferase MtaB, partial [Mesorhizobium sp. M2A.F.Ca.ET.037.01.1.1]